MFDSSFIVWLQQFSNGFLDSFFTIITTVGNPEYYMIAFPFIYWCISKRMAYRFTIFFLLSTYVNTIVKGFTDVARPCSSEVRVLYGDSTYGSSSFPSGHTQGTASFWGYLAYYFKNRYFTCFAVVLTALVGLSRIYLGLHFAIDVVAGLFIAIMVLTLFNLFYDKVASRLDGLSWKLKVGLSTVLPLLLLVPPGHDKGMLVGFAIGLMVGYQLDKRYLNFSNSATIAKQGVKFVIGVVGLFVLRVVLKELFEVIGFSALTEHGADMVRYLFVGLWASYFAPYLFVKLGLSKEPKIEIGQDHRVKV
ncbi:phosphatase PAP2 family protein [Proteinivorax hydrogeniformans]|uniref:Phosphatase PAP2 family protein n=1 Tax=Proteinivorax hydrogeniformans TaxID=1826727 RepID=A0AAU8HX10_9FIRM